MATTDGSLNVAVVGYGMAGKTFHAPLVAATSGLRLHSIVSSSAAKVAEDYPGALVRTELAEALADQQVDLVVLATPDHLHASQALAALDAGKHVVVDKPFALSADEAEPVVRRARGLGRLLSIFQNRRWDGDFLTVRKLIKQGALGEIYQFESRFDRFRPSVLDRWKDRRSAGVWQDLGPHLVDQALQLFGMPRAIYADLAMQKKGAGAIDYFHVLLRYDRLRVILHAGQLVPDHSLRFAVHGSRGSFIKRGLDPQESALARGGRPADDDWGKDEFPGELSRVSEDGAVSAGEHEAVRGDYAAYYMGVRDSILLGGPNPVPPEEGLAVMRVLDAGRLSSHEAREIALS